MLERLAGDPPGHQGLERRRVAGGRLQEQRGLVLGVHAAGRAQPRDQGVERRRRHEPTLPGRRATGSRRVPACAQDLDARRPARARARDQGLDARGRGAVAVRGVRSGAARGPALEIGAYCGKSAVYLGAAALVLGGPAAVVFTVDHHRGSEEIQPGWEHHDPEVVDPATGRMDSLPFLRRTLAEAGLEERVVAIVGASRDGRRTLAHPAVPGVRRRRARRGIRPADYTGWARWLVAGGSLAVHDVFERPEDGGQAPYHLVRRAVATGDFDEVESRGSLRVLRRVSGDAGDVVR